MADDGKRDARCTGWQTSNKMRVMAGKPRARTEVGVERMWAVPTTPATNFVVKAEVAMVFPP